MGIGCLGLFDEAPLLLPVAVDVIGVGAALLTAPGLVTSFELELADFARMQRGTRPSVALLLVQEMPDQDGELAGRCDGGHVAHALP